MLCGITLAYEKFEYTKGVFRSRISKKGRQCNEQERTRDKQLSTKHYTEN
jgi:hypothetical protein